jgi:hypothetical protein
MFHVEHIKYNNFIFLLPSILELDILVFILYNKKLLEILFILELDTGGICKKLRKIIDKIKFYLKINLFLFQIYL